MYRNSTPGYRCRWRRAASLAESCSDSYGVFDHRHQFNLSKVNRITITKTNSLVSNSEKLVSFGEECLFEGRVPL